MSKKPTTRRETSRQFSVSFPESLLKEIELICATKFMTRTSWLVQAAQEKINADRIEKMNKLKDIGE